MDRVFRSPYAASHRLASAAPRCCPQSDRASTVLRISATVVVLTSYGQAARRKEKRPAATDLRAALGAVCFDLRLKALSQNGVSLETSRCSFGTAGDEDFGACLGKEVNSVHGYAGHFSLATVSKRHPAGTLVLVTVSALDPSRLVLDFSNHHEVLTDACVLLCGSIGALVLLELGYTGPLIRRPRLAAREEAHLHDVGLAQLALQAFHVTEGVDLDADRSVTVLRDGVGGSGTAPVPGAVPRESAVRARAATAATPPTGASPRPGPAAATRSPRRPGRVRQMSAFRFWLSASRSPVKPRSSALRGASLNSWSNQYVRITSSPSPLSSKLGSEPRST